MEGENINANKSEESLVSDHKDEQNLIEMDQSEAIDKATAETNGGNEGEQEGEKVNREDENGDKEENEFVVWADDAEEMEDDKRKAEESSTMVKKLYGIEMSKDTDELLVTWNGKEVIVPCKEEVSRDIRYHNRQLHLVAYPVCWKDLEDPALKHSLVKATNICLEINHIQEDPSGKGYLRVKFNSMGLVNEVREALEALPPLPKTPESPDAVSTETDTPVTQTIIKSESNVEGAEVKVEKVKVEKVEEGGGDEKKKEEEVKKENEAEKMAEGDTTQMKEEVKVEEEEKVVDENKRNITIVLYCDNISESKIMAKFKTPSVSKDAMTSRLLYVAYSGLEVSERELSEKFQDCSRVIMACRDNKSKGYAYIEYPSQVKMREALVKFRESPVSEWFVIEAVNQCKAEVGLLKDELRSYWLEQIKNLEATDRTSKTPNEISDLDQKLIRYKKRIINDNTKRQDFGFVIAESEIYTLSKEEMESSDNDKNKDRSTRNQSISRKRSRSRRRRSPVRFQKFQRKFERGRPGQRSGGSSYVSASSRRTSTSNNEGGMLVNQLQQLVGALSNNMSQQTVQNINRNFSGHASNSYNDTYNTSQFNSTSGSYNRSSLAEDRSRFGDYNGSGLSQRSRFDNYESSDRKRRYNDVGDRYSGRYEQDYRGYRGNGY